MIQSAKFESKQNQDRPTVKSGICRLKNLDKSPSIFLDIFQE